MEPDGAGSNPLMAESAFAALGLSFPVCKMGIITVAKRVVVKIK